MTSIDAEHRASTFVPHGFEEHTADLGEIRMNLLGAIADHQADRVRQLVEGAGQPFTYRSFPGMPHSMHGADPELYARTVTGWASDLPEPV